MTDIFVLELQGRCPMVGCLASSCSQDDMLDGALVTELLFSQLRLYPNQIVIFDCMIPTKYFKHDAIGQFFPCL